MYSSRGMPAGGLKATRALLLVSSQKLRALAVAAVERAPTSAGLNCRAVPIRNSSTVRGSRSSTNSLPGRGADRLAADDHAVGVEVGVDEGPDQVAVPRRGAGQRAGGRVVPGVARVDGVLAVVGPGGADAGLDHLARTEVVHLVLVAGGEHVAGEGGRVLAQPLAVQRVVAGDHAEVERPVLPADGVVELDVLGVVLGVDGRHLRRRSAAGTRAV